MPSSTCGHPPHPEWHLCHKQQSNAIAIHSCGGPQCGHRPHKVRYPQPHSSPIHTALCHVISSLASPKVYNRTHCKDGHDTIF